MSSYGMYLWYDRNGVSVIGEEWFLGWSYIFISYN